MSNAPAIKRQNTTNTPCIRGIFKRLRAMTLKGFRFQYLLRRRRMPVAHEKHGLQVCGTVINRDYTYKKLYFKPK